MKPLVALLWPPFWISLQRKPNPMEERHEVSAHTQGFSWELGHVSCPCSQTHLVSSLSRKDNTTFLPLPPLQLLVPRSTSEFKTWFYHDCRPWVLRGNCALLGQSTPQSQEEREQWQLRRMGCPYGAEWSNPYSKHPLCPFSQARGS